MSVCVYTYMCLREYMYMHMYIYWKGNLIRCK